MFDDCKSTNYVRKDILERLILTDMNSLLKDFEINTEKMLASLEEKFQFQADKEIRKNDENGVNLEKFISAVEKYSHLERLSVEIANELVDKIMIHLAQGRGKMP